MVTVRLHDGIVERWSLVESERGLLRLQRASGASCDLLAMVCQAGWRIVEADDEDRAMLERFGIHGGRLQ